MIERSAARFQPQSFDVAQSLPYGLFDNNASRAKLTGAGNAGKTMPRPLRVLGKYFGHLIVGAAMFAALLSFGIATNDLVQWSEPLVRDSRFGQLMSPVEKVILYSDVLLLVWWMAFSTYKAIMELHDE
jgi:hypothetical protein